MSEKIDHYLQALQQRNLVYNSDFRYFSNQKKNDEIVDYGIPDGWLYQDNGVGATINFDSLNHNCVIQKSKEAGTMCFSQALHEFPRWKQLLLNQTITAKVILSSDIEGDVRVSLSDGISKKTMTIASTGESEFNLQLDINKNAIQLILSIETSVPNKILKVSNCFANVGFVAIAQLPCIINGVIGERKQYIATEFAPAEELSLCHGIHELSDEYTRLRSVINNQFGVNPETNNPYLINMSGFFSRAWNNSTGVDPDSKDRTAHKDGGVLGDHVGTIQDYEVQNHDHRMNFSTTHQLAGDKRVISAIDNSSISKTERAGGRETRPTNIAELYTIKWA